MASPASAETSSVVIILPDGVTKKTFEISRRRTVDEVKQIVLTRNYKIKGLRADYYLVVNDHDVIYPEYKKFFDSHPALEGDAAKVTVRLVPKADVIDGSDGKKTYVPKPENKSQFLSLTESANTRRKSVMLDEELERARLDAETEARRRKRMSREAKEEEQLRLKMELEEQKKREMLAAKAEEDRKRRQAERDKQEALRRQKEAEEDAVWHKLQEERRHTREEERKRLLHHSSLMIDRSKLKEVLKAGPTAVHAESQQAAAVQEPTSPHAGLSRSYAVNPTHAAAVSRTSTGSSAAEKQLEVLEEALAKAERDAAKRQKEIDALKAANAKLETDLDTNKSLVSTLQLRLERTERDVERQRVVAENRAAAADREIAALKAIGTRYKAVRDGVAGELQRINSTQSESLNLVETRVVLDRVRDRLDSALSGHNWRSTKPEFSTVLFSIDELKEQLLKWPPKNPAAVAAAAEAEAEKAKAKAQPVSDTPPSTPSILISSFDSSNPPSSPAPVDATTSYETPRKPPTVEATPEVEKIANLPIEQEIDYWQVLPTFGDLLGEGGYAEVFRAEYNGRPVAVKKFKIDYQAMEDGNPPMDTDLIRKEIVILSKLNHPNIMKFYGASVIMPNICIVTELLVKGSLDVLIHDTPDFDMPFAWRVQRSIEVCQGLAYLHSVNPIVIHRDIKSANVLLDEKYTAKLSDFGLAKLKRNVFEMPSPKNSGIPPKWLVVLNSSPVGTAAWCAPEILESAPYNESSDIYSFGVFLWEFFTRLSPWTGHAAKSIIEMTIGGRRLDIPADMHPVLAELMKSSWNYDPWQRPTSADILAKLKSLQH